jgi:S1-C subfamily serine protease
LTVECSVLTLQLLGIKRGILVLDAPAGSTAQRAGLRGTSRGMTYPHDSIVLGDIIVGIGADTVNSEADLFRAIEKYKVGDTVTLRVLRAKADAGVSKSGSFPAPVEDFDAIDEYAEYAQFEKRNFDEITLKLTLSAPQFSL